MFILIVIPVLSQNLTIEISGIRNNKGVIQLMVYHDKETYASETPCKAFTFPKTGMNEGKITVVIPNLETGTYGIALIDDENENGKIDRHFFIPCEGFGFSNFYFKGSRKPEFESFAFQFSDNNNSICIKVQYF
jgi:uncharacterized protein (DUF2141 family)